MSLDERKQKHVSFDSSSILRSQTVGNMSEPETHTLSTPSKSSERLLDGRKTPDYALYSELFTPELARQIVLGNEPPVIEYPVILPCHIIFSEFRSFKTLEYEDTGHTN